MAQTTARIKKGNHHFEILVDMDEALKFKKGENMAANFLEIDTIFKDIKKGEKASHDELEIAFGSADVDEISKEIVKRGEVLVNQEQRSAEHEQKIKQVVDFLATNAIDPQTKNPITPQRIKSALEEAHVNIKNTPLENQIQEIIDKIAPILPIKIETKKVKLIVPAVHTGKVYGLINDYKETENWLDDGSLVVTVNVPAGLIFDFYDKINSASHGSIVSEELNQD